MSDNSTTTKKSASKQLSAHELEAIAEAEAKASAARLKVAQVAADAALEKQYQATAKELTKDADGDSYTDKRSGDVIFRRELGEPEFWLDKQDRIPSRPVLTDDQIKEISQQVEIPKDQTPKYEPKHILSKEFGGTSNYEVGLGPIREEAEQRLEYLKKTDASASLIAAAQEDIKKLDHLYENYHIGMNVFRTAKGGRDKIKK